MIGTTTSWDKGSDREDEKLIVPITTCGCRRRRCRRSIREGQARRDKQREAQARAAKALPAARQAWHDGDFAGVKGALSEVELDVDYLDTTQAIEVRAACSGRCTSRTGTPSQRSRPSSACSSAARRIR